MENLTKATTLGCYMIVKNEEQCIADCLNSIIDVCDEIIVVDTGCSDKTMEIVSSFGDKVKTYFFEWIDDFAAARNFAMSKISSDYCFTTDADETFTDKLKQNVLELKKCGFHGLDCYNIWLYNYESGGGSFYLGGRCIVKNYPENEWKYNIHEKLYFKCNTTATISKEDGFIFHKHPDGKNSDSNYGKYAEMYYNKLNGGENLFLRDYYGAHFFYYLFLTIKNIDILPAKKYLSEMFRKSRIRVSSEDFRKYMYIGNLISAEEMYAYELITNNTDNLFKNDIANTLKEPLAKYYVLKNVYDTDKDCLSEDGWINLAYLSYTNGFVDDFIDATNISHEKYGKNATINHNFNFAQHYIIPAFSKNMLLIDCSNGTMHLASLINYFSHMFETIVLIGDADKLSNFHTNIVKKPLIANDKSTLSKFIEKHELTPYSISANTLLDRKQAMSEFEKIMYGKPTNILTKNAPV